MTAREAFVMFRRRRRPIQVIHQRCRGCGTKRRVVADSVTARERKCNRCVIAEANRPARTQADLEVIR